jgi:Tfp pilus assembly protein PilF
MRFPSNNPRLRFAYVSYLLTFILLFCAAAISYGQVGGIETTGTGGRHSIKGRVVFPSGQRADVRLQVRLESTSGGDISVMSDMNGSFSFQSLRPGSYSVVVDGGEYYESTRESVFIEPATVSTRRSPGAVVPLSRPFTVQIYLRAKRSSNVTKTGVLDANLAALPAKAVEHYQQALTLNAQGNSQQAIEELKLAVAVHPQFGLALNALGVQYLKAGQLDKSAEVLKNAVSVSPDALEPRINYGVVLLNQRKYAEAEEQLQQALKKNNSSVTGHLYLGIALINLKRYQEAEAALQKSIALGGNKVGQAHYYLGGLYWRSGDYKRAADELEQYLSVEPKASNAEKVKATIKDLRMKS